MPLNELLVDVLRKDIGLFQMTVADMTDADLLQRPVPGSNNALWQLGHVIKAEAGMVNQAAGKTLIELPAGFADRFKRDTANVDDVAKLATKDELVALLSKVREQTAAILGHPVVVSYISRLECEKITSNLKSTNKVSEFKKVRSTGSKS